MQDHPHYNVSPEQGWAKLKPVLDEVMPVDRRQKRFGYFWWATSTLLICGVVGLGFVIGASALLNPPSTGQTEIHNEGKKMAPDKTEKDAALPPAANESKEKTNETSIHNGEKQNPKVNQATILRPDNIPAQSKTSVLPPASKTTNIEQTTPMAMMDNKDEEGIHSMTEMQASPIDYTADVQVDSGTDVSSQEYTATTTSSLRNGQVVELIPSLSEVAFRSSDPTEASVPTMVMDKSKRKPAFLEPNVAVSGLIGPDGGTGYYGGAGLNVNVSRRFGFTSAIGYMSFGPEASLFGGSKSLDAANPGSNNIIQYDPDYFGNETYLDPTYINNSIGYNAILPLVERVNQWQVDLGMKWKWSGRFYTDAGVKLGFQTKAYSAYPIINVSSVGTSYPIAQFDNSLNSYNVIRSNTTSIYAGVGYRFGDHLEVFTNWTHAFDEYLLNEDISSEADMDAGKRTDYIRGLSVGLRYTL